MCVCVCVCVCVPLTLLIGIMLSQMLFVVLALHDRISYHFDCFCRHWHQAITPKVNLTIQSQKLEITEIKAVKSLICMPCYYALRCAPKSAEHQCQWTSPLTQSHCEIHNDYKMFKNHIYSIHCKKEVTMNLSVLCVLIFHEKCLFILQVIKIIVAYAN